MKRAICINPYGVNLTLKDEYTILKENDKLYKVQDDNGDERLYSKSRFEVLE